LQNPAILVECGFVSNSEEAALLQNSDYQKKLALVIMASVLECEYKNQNA
jgi:N-acetylmuramoyl-L-alanine amidase